MDLVKTLCLTRKGPGASSNVGKENVGSSRVHPRTSKKQPSKHLLMTDTAKARTAQVQVFEFLDAVGGNCMIS